MPPDTSLFSDVADALGIAHPAIVEKDYYAVQLLKLLSTLEIPGYTLVFAGSTCLAKVHQNIWRMSEDIDIKLVPEEKTRSLSRENQRQLRRDVHQKIIKLKQASDTFNFDGEPKKRNESRFQQFLIQYPTHYARFHVYDLHLIVNQKLDPEHIKDLVHQVIETDVNQFGNQHPEF